MLKRVKNAERRRVPAAPGAPAEDGFPLGSYGESFGRRIFRRFCRHRMGLVSLFVLSFLILAALLGPFLLPYAPSEMAGPFNQPPSAAHLLGTDAIGRDILARLLSGMRISLLASFLATAISTAIGVLLGLLSAYLGSWVDVFIMRFTDMVMSFPYLLLVLVAAAIFRPGLWNIILILGFIDWPGVARLVRGNVLSLREQAFVQAGRLAGLPRRKIIFSDILPNTMAPVLIYATSVMAISMLDEAALSFLSLGVQPPTPSLGNMLGDAQSLTVLTQRPWLWLPPGICIILLVVSINFIGDALRDAFDPKS